MNCRLASLAAKNYGMAPMHACPKNKTQPTQNSKYVVSYKLSVGYPFGSRLCLFQLGFLYYFLLTSANSSVSYLWYATYYEASSKVYSDNKHYHQDSRGYYNQRFYVLATLSDVSIFVSNSKNFPLKFKEQLLLDLPLTNHIRNIENLLI